MKFFKIIFALFIAFAPAVAFAQTANVPAFNIGPMATPNPIAPGITIVAPPATGGGIINIGQAFGTLLQPYIDAAVQVLILAAVSYFGLFIKKKFNVDIDKKSSDELTKFLQNRASSLIADGAVKMSGVTVKVDNQRLADAANAALNSVPDAIKRFGLTPDVIAAKIVDAIPQVAAGAAIVAQAHAEAPPITTIELANAAPTPDPTPTGKPA